MSEETYLTKALGPLSALLDDPSVIEIAVNPDGTVWTERSGDAWMRTADIMLAQPDARLLASQLAGPKSLGANTPLVISSRPRGKDVWRVQIVGQPVTPTGYSVSLRRDVLRDVSLDAFEYSRAVAASTSRASPTGSGQRMRAAKGDPEALKL